MHSFNHRVNIVAQLTYTLHQLGESATGVIAHFCVSLAALLLLAECSLQRRRALPESRKNAHSRPSNCRFQDNFNPTFYYDFYTQSGHKIVSDFLCLYGPVLQSQVVKLPPADGFRAAPERAVLLVIAQKLNAAPASWPMQSKYQHNAELKA